LRKITEQMLDDFGAGVTLFDQLANAGLAHGDQRKFRGGEKGIHANQREHGEELQGNHRVIACGEGSSDAASTWRF